ncbi:MAG: YbaN family protein [Betaproteobacteria bacterium]|nr:YbaN family protein [Betaproteobacteria bacterium]
MREHDSRVIRVVLAALGLVFVGVGIAGVVLPVLPATPFFLLAAACFARASVRFYNWLLNHRVLGPTAREWQLHRSIPYRTKLWAIALMSGTLAISTLFFVEGLVLQLLLAALGALLAIWLWRVPSRDAPER